MEEREELVSVRVGTGRIGDDEWGARRRPVVKHPRSSLFRLSLSCILRYLCNYATGEVTGEKASIFCASRVGPDPAGAESNTVRV
jgi:hypothetical protein